MRRLALPFVLLVMAVLIPVVLHHPAGFTGDQALQGEGTVWCYQTPIPVQVDMTVVSRPGTHRISGPRTVAA